MERGSLPVEREPPAPGDAKPAGHEMRQVRVLVGSGETSSHSHWLKKEKREIVHSCAPHVPATRK